MTENPEADRIRRRVFWAMPSGIYVVGSRAGEQQNFMTLNWATQVSSKPVRVGVGVQKDAFTHRLMTDGDTFSLNLIHREDRALIRKFVKPAPLDLEAMTLNGVKFREGMSGAPILVDALGFLDCRITHKVDAGDHTFFIGDVIDAGFEKPAQGNNPEDFEVLRMEDTRMNYGG